MRSQTDSDGRALKDIIASSLALLGQFTPSLSSDQDIKAAVKPIQNPPNPLRVLSDSAKLVKAHTTKLSLLAINKPFTPSAITKVLRDLSGTCLPAMMSAVQICEQEKARWGSMMGKEVQARVRRVFRELEVLLKEILAIAEGSHGTARRDSLSSTGVVWESCDALIELEVLGIGGLALQRAEQNRDTIKDAIQELQDWAEGDDPDTEGREERLLDSDDEGVAGDRDSIEDLFNAANSMPADRPELTALAEEADRKLKKVVILYNALQKRRISTFKSDVGSNGYTRAQRLDDLMLHLKKIPYRVDEMAGSLYDLDEQGAKDLLQSCLNEALVACNVVQMDWEGNEDAFTTWLRKWKEALG